MARAMAAKRGETRAMSPGSVLRWNDLHTAISGAGLKYAHPADLPSTAREDNTFDWYAQDLEITPQVVAQGRAVSTAMRALQDKGFGALADYIAKKVPVIALPTTRGNEGIQMATLPTPKGMYLLIPTSVTQGYNNPDMPLHSYSPLSTAEAHDHFVKTGDVKGAGEVEATGAALHEMGHVLDLQTGEAMSRRLVQAMIKTLGDDWQRKGPAWIRKNISGYAQASPSEMTAEAFEKIVLGEPLPPELDGWVEGVKRAATYGTGTFKGALGDLSHRLGYFEGATNTAPTEIAKLYARVHAPDGGFTYQPKLHSEPDHGFAVSPYPERSFAKPAKDFTAADLKAYVLKNKAMFDDPHNYVGGWNDPESGKVFLDISVVNEDQKAAEALARKSDQIAIFNLKTFTTITVNRGATSGGVVDGGKDTDGQVAAS
jgi:hypothetical protein